MWEMQSSKLHVAYLLQTIFRIRGIQDVHCVMHKCIMVKAGGNEKHRKHVKNT